LVVTRWLGWEFNLDCSLADTHRTGVLGDALFVSGVCDDAGAFGCARPNTVLLCRIPAYASRVYIGAVQTLLEKRPCVTITYVGVGAIGHACPKVLLLCRIPAYASRVDIWAVRIRLLEV
jgi:hypothetical protein